MERLIIALILQGKIFQWRYKKRNNGVYEKEELCDNHIFPKSVANIGLEAYVGCNTPWEIVAKIKLYHLDSSRVGAWLQANTATHIGWRLIAENQGNNVFEFSCENIRSFNCYLHPAMADLDKPIEVRINGRKTFCTPLPDHTRPDYTAKITVTVPDKV